MVLLLVATGFYAGYQHLHIQRQKEIAENIFYTMKSLEVELLQLQQVADAMGDEQTAGAVRMYRDRKREMTREYDRFLDELNVYESGVSEADRLIYRIARIFGDSEITLPGDFKREVHNYIRRWQTNDRLDQAIERAVANGYHELIAQVMLDHDLPPQFFYLALQESDFRFDSVGPQTWFGIAKSMWQFIPHTAARYGLRTGPCVVS